MKLKLHEYAKPLSTRQEYMADVGYVTPLIYDDPMQNLKIDLFENCTAIAQNTAAEFILNHWSEEVKCTDAESTKNYVKTHWSGGNFFYLLLIQNQCVGCIGIDRKNFLPFVSHLYVQKEWRSKGLARAMLAFAEENVRAYGFDEVRLWCIPALKTFYEKLSWIQEDIQDGMLIMKKKIASSKARLRSFENCGGYASHLF